MGYRAHNRIFNEEQEQELSKYLIRCADLYFGLPKKEVRKLACELSIKYTLSRPRSWEDKQMAVPTKEQENVDERQETLSTPPRRCSSIINQETSPRPSTRVQAISKNPIVFTPEAVRPLPKAPPRKSNKRQEIRKSTIYTDTPEKEAIRKEHETGLNRIKTKQVKKSLYGRKAKKILQEEKKVIHSKKYLQKRKNATVLFVCHHIQKADPEKSAQKVVLAMFATIATQIDPYAKF
ncbi:hypothetical protein JTB14_014390 [Gonioctena quinquepunctata]|nr:hypothetical protein JTB14_014390 [Gonioctena quinquepunctata]